MELQKRYKMLIKKVRFFTYPRTLFTSFCYFVCYFYGLALTSSMMMMRRRRRRKMRRRKMMRKKSGG